MKTFEQYLYSMYTRKTTDAYLRHVERFKVRVENPDHATYKEMVSYFNAYKQSPVGLASLKAYFDYLVLEGVRDDHPCKRMTLKRPRKAIQIQDLFSMEELELLLDRENRYQFLKYRNKSIISLLIYQALTPENIIRLDISDIDFDAGTIYIKGTKKLSRRVLELKAKQIHVLYRYVHEHRPKLNPHAKELFFSKTGSRLTLDVLQNLVEVFQYVFPDRSINLTKIRQSVVSHWLNELEIPIEDVQLMSGHKWLSSIEKYKSEGRVSKIEKINKFFPL